MTIIIGVSGKKQSGKSCLCEYLTDRYWAKEKFGSIKVYSFADPLKRFCIYGMGLSEAQCYGSDEDKNTFTEYSWDTLPLEIRNEFGKKEAIKVQVGGWENKEFGGMEWCPRSMDSFEIKPRTGLMTSREVLQIFGTNIMRKMFSDKIWVNAAISLIRRESPKIAFIADARFKSEIEALMNDDNGYVIRLTRKVSEDSHPSETELDDYDFSQLGDRCLVIDNHDMTIEEKNAVAIPFFEKIAKI